MDFLVMKLNKGGRLKDFWIGKDKEEYFEKEESEDKTGSDKERKK